MVRRTTPSATSARRKRRLAPSRRTSRAACRALRAEEEARGGDRRLEAKEKELKELRDQTIGQIGNIVPDDVPVFEDEDNNVVVNTSGSFDREDWMLSHYDIVQLAGLAKTATGSVVAGSRGYVHTGMGLRLIQALISYAVQFLSDRVTMIQTPS